MALTNTLSCAHKRLKVIKQVVNDGFGPPPPLTSFVVDVMCLPAPHTTVTLGANNNYQQTVTLGGANTSCSFSEHQPPVPANLARPGCRWVTPTIDHKKSIDPAATWWRPSSIIGSARKGGGDSGQLTVRKIVVTDNPGGPPPPPTSFIVTALCLPGPHTTFALNSGNNYQHTITLMGANASCSFTEQPPPVSVYLARLGCHWVIPTTDRHRAKAAGFGSREANIVNHWVCKKGSGGKGKVRVIKTVVNGTGGAVPQIPTTYTMNINCTGESSQSLTVPAGPIGASTSVTAPATCSVQETGLTPILHVKACKGGPASWTTYRSHPRRPPSPTVVRSPSMFATFCIAAKSRGPGNDRAPQESGDRRVGSHAGRGAGLRRSPGYV